MMLFLKTKYDKTILKMILLKIYSTKKVKVSNNTSNKIQSLSPIN